MHTSFTLLFLLSVQPCPNFWCHCFIFECSNVLRKLLPIKFVVLYKLVKRYSVSLDYGYDCLNYNYVEMTSSNQARDSSVARPNSNSWYVFTSAPCSVYWEIIVLLFSSNYLFWSHYMTGMTNGEELSIQIVCVLGFRCEFSLSLCMV